MTAISATTRQVKTMADGTLRLTIDIEPNDAAQAFTLFGQPSVAVAIARLTQQAAQQDARRKAAKPYGEAYKALYLHGWFYSRDVAEALGTDAEYQDWVRTQPSAYSGGCDWDCDKGEPRCEYAHVRRARDSGTGYKPKFSGIPLTHAEHHIQHQHGESALEGLDMEKKAGEYLAKWIKIKLYQLFGVQSLGEVEPRKFRETMIALSIAGTLPNGWGADE